MEFHHDDSSHGRCPHPHKQAARTRPVWSLRFIVALLGERWTSGRLRGGRIGLRRYTQAAK